MDSLFIITIIFIFISVLVGTYMKSRSFDKCLDDFNKFHVTLEEIDGDVIWGKLKVYSTGFILKFDSPVEGKNELITTSYILYESQYSTIHSLYRFHDELTEENQKKREKLIKRAYSGAFLYRLFRKLRGLINTFKDAIIKSVGIVIGQMQKVNPGSSILKSQQKNITNISSDIVGYAGNSFDPILEDLIGTTIIIDIFKDNKKYSFKGLLIEYSDKFVVINDIHDTLSYKIPLLTSPIKLVSKYLKIVQDKKNNFNAENSGEIPFTLEKITGKGKNSEGIEEIVDIKLDCKLESGKNKDIATPDLIYSEIFIFIKVDRDFDVIIPRSHSVIRHESKKIEENEK